MVDNNLMKHTARILFGPDYNYGLLSTMDRLLSSKKAQIYEIRQYELMHTWVYVIPIFLETGSPLSTTD